MAQGVGIVLILVATRDLVDTLTDERGEGMRACRAPPVRHLSSDLGTQADVGINLREPREAAVRGEATAIEGGVKGERSEGMKAEGRCGRIGHEEASVVGP